jgi:hypothetical protein
MINIYLFNSNIFNQYYKNNIYIIKFKNKKNND